MLRRLIACALLVWYLPACMVWRVSDGANVKQIVETERPVAVRLTLSDGRQVMLDSPRIVAGDSVAGSRDKPAKVAVSDVTQVAIHKESVARTAALVVALVSVFAVVAAVRVSQAN